eukprot:UN00417
MLHFIFHIARKQLTYPMNLFECGICVSLFPQLKSDKHKLIFFEIFICGRKCDKIDKISFVGFTFFVTRLQRYLVGVPLKHIIVVVVGQTETLIKLLKKKQNK